MENERWEERQSFYSARQHGVTVLFNQKETERITTVPPHANKKDSAE